MALKNWKGGKVKNVFGGEYYAWGKNLDAGFGKVSTVTVSPESLHRLNGIWLVRLHTPKIVSNKQFDNEAKALKYAKSYMRTH